MNVNNHIELKLELPKENWDTVLRTLQFSESDKQ